MPQKKSPAKTEGEKTPLHYRLTNEEWLQAVHDLKPSERDLLYHLRTLDPFGDRTLNLTVTGLAEALNVHKSTISRALKILDSKGYIDLDMLTVRVRLRTSCSQATVLPENHDVALEQPALSQSNQKDLVATDVVLEQPDRSLSNIRSCKPLLEGSSELSQTIQTDQTNSISPKEERENDNLFFQQSGELSPEYQAWLRQRLEQLPERPIFPELVIESLSRREKVQQDFLNYQNALRERNVPHQNSVGAKIYSATSDDVYWMHLGICRSALNQGNQASILSTFEALWQEGWQDVCVKICNQLPECEIEIGENGPEVLRPIEDI